MRYVIEMKHLNVYFIGRYDRKVNATIEVKWCAEYRLQNWWQFKSLQTLKVYSYNKKV